MLLLVLHLLLLRVMLLREVLQVGVVLLRRERVRRRRACSIREGRRREMRLHVRVGVHVLRHAVLRRVRSEMAVLLRRRTRVHEGRRRRVLVLMLVLRRESLSMRRRCEQVRHGRCERATSSVGLWGLRHRG